MPGAAEAAASSRTSRAYWTAFTLLGIPAAWHLPFRAPARLAALQNRRLRAMVAHAHATVPYYRDAMRERGLRPEHFRTVDDLAKLPIVSGAELARDPRRFLSTAVGREPLLEVTTSGSSGHAKRIWWDRAAVFGSRACGVRHRHVQATLLGRWRGARALSIGPRTGTAAKVGAFYDAHSWFPRAVATQSAKTDPSESFERNLAKINAARPDLVTGFGAYIAAIYRWADAHGRAIHRPRLIAYGGEHMTAADRRFLETTLGIAVTSSYQSCEAFRIALQCHLNAGFHIHVDQVALRVVDEQGETLPPGQRGRIVLSNLTNRATVLLNYATGDLGSMAGAPCPCGRTLPMLATLDGREDDLIVLPGDERLHDSTLLPRLYDVPGVIRVQVVQETLDRFRVRVVHSRALADGVLRERLAAALGQVIGPHLGDVQVEIDDEIPCAPGAKFRCVVSRVPDRGPIRPGALAAPDPPAASGP